MTALTALFIAIAPIIAAAPSLFAFSSNARPVTAETIALDPARQDSEKPEEETSTSILLLNGRTGETTSFDLLIDDLQRRDVVFLGELHNNTAFHELQLAIFSGLAQRRPGTALSLEMFERDTQGIINDYLLGRITEEVFLAHSRPWKNYHEHYRPLVEFAKSNRMDVLAANVPREVAAEVARSGDALDPDLWLPRDAFAPRNQYFDRFTEAMGSHAGADGMPSIGRMYQAQCLKDDAMAEAIVDYQRMHRYRRPLVVHMCGQFHSDFGLGTVERVIWRDVTATIGIVSTVAVTNPQDYQVTKQDLGRANYLFIVPEEPPKEEPTSEAKADS